jgi:hypothetical protein
MTLRRLTRYPTCARDCQEVTGEAGARATAHKERTSNAGHGPKDKRLLNCPGFVHTSFAGKDDGAMPSRYDASTKAKALRLVREHAVNYPTEHATITSRTTLTIF